MQADHTLMRMTHSHAQMSPFAKTENMSPAGQQSRLTVTARHTVQHARPDNLHLRRRTRRLTACAMMFQHAHRVGTKRRHRDHHPIVNARIVRLDDTKRCRTRWYARCAPPANSATRRCPHRPRNRRRAPSAAVGNIKIAWAKHHVCSACQANFAALPRLQRPRLKRARPAALVVIKILQASCYA